LTLKLADTNDAIAHLAAETAREDNAQPLSLTYGTWPGPRRWPGWTNWLCEHIVAPTNCWQRLSTIRIQACCCGSAADIRVVKQQRHGAAPDLGW